MDKITAAIKWFSDRQGLVTYSMTNRNGPDSYDCSSSVYYSTIGAGLLPKLWIGNTDSLYNDLERNGWSQVQPDANGNIAAQRGDVFLWGKRGASAGAFGHTGEFIDADNIIHCSYGYNGIHVDNHDWLSAINGYPELTIYRYTGAAYSPPSIQGSPDDQVLEVGSYIKFEKTYTADVVEQIDGIWQVRTNELCTTDFTWEDNGIPAGPLVEVDADGYALDQELDNGSLYKIPGKYQVLDLYEADEGWYALIEMDGLRLWVDVATATEVSSSDAGTPIPTARPTNQSNTPPTPSQPPETPKTPETSTQPSEPEKPQEQPKNDIPAPTTTPTEPTKEVTMAFSQEQQKELAIAQQSVLDANTAFEPIISEKVKTIVYFATDICAIVATLVLTILSILKFMDAVVAITLNASLVTALLGLKQTFRLSAKKQ